MIRLLSSGGVGSAHATTDITISADPTFTDLCSCSVSGTSFLIHAMVTGIISGNTTGIIRVKVDGTAYDYLGTYTNTCNFGGGTFAMQGILVAAISSLSAGSHTFLLQGAYSGNSWAVHASTNPTREGAALIVQSLG